MAVINTNILSLNAQRNLGNSQGALATSLERLSSGLRINSAKDDAAGLAISERFTTQIRGLNQAVRNSNDGISLAQTAEGALGELNNNLQRIRELAVQSANATNSNADRAALDQEVQQRLAEINRIAEQTSFNGRNVLDGTFGNATFQVGANVGQTIGVDLNTSMRLDSIGDVAIATSVDLAGVINEAQDAVANVSSQSGTFTDITLGDGTSSPETFSLAVGGVSILTVSSTTGTETVTAADIDAALDTATTNALDAAGITVTGSAADGNLAFTNADGESFDIVVTNDSGAGGFAGADFAATTNTVDNGSEAVSAVALTLGAGDLQIAIGDADPVTVAAGTYESRQDLVDAINLALTGEARASINEDNELVLTAQDTITVTADNDAANLGFAGVTETSGNLVGTNVLSVAGANDTISRIDSALTSVSDLRSDFGAVQNRFESTIANLSATVENLESSRSRIRDADFAAETANLTRAQILQQAGISVLSQANAQPQNVLALLQ
jgi:flagellin